MLYMRFPQGRAKALTFSYDDAVEQDMDLVAILDKYGLYGTFNINTGLFFPEDGVHPQGEIQRRMTEKQIRQLFSNGRHEVASHTVTHPHLNQLTKTMACNEIIMDKAKIEDMFGTIIRGGAYPYGAVNDSVVDALSSTGIAYYRTTVASEAFDIPEDWLRLKATCHHTDPSVMELAKKFLTDQVRRAPYLFYLWGHSYEFERDNNWSLIEEFCSYLGGRQDIWYATNIAIFEYIEAYNRRVTSTDGSIIHNPTDIELWFFDGVKTFSVKSGETKRL